MINLQNVFNTEVEANEAQEYDFGKHMEFYADNNGYDELTSKWAGVKQRITDNKYFYAVCPCSDVTYTTEAFDSSWVPEEEE